MLVFCVLNNEFLLRIVDNDICVKTNFDSALAVVDTEQLSRVCSGNLYSLFERDSALVCFGQDVRVHVFDTSASVRNCSEVSWSTVFLCDSPVFFGFQERAVVCSQSGYSAVLDTIPQRFQRFFALHWRRAYEVASS